MLASIWQIISKSNLINSRKSEPRLRMYLLANWHKTSIYHFTVNISYLIKIVTSDKSALITENLLGKIFFGAGIDIAQDGNCDITSQARITVQASNAR